MWGSMPIFSKKTLLAVWLASRVGEVHGAASGAAGSAAGPPEDKMFDPTKEFQIQFPNSQQKKVTVMLLEEKNPSHWQHSNSCTCEIIFAARYNNAQCERGTTASRCANANALFLVFLRLVLAWSPGPGPGVCCEL